MEEFSNDESQGQEKSNGGNNSSRSNISGSNGPHIEPPTILKSNLKKTITTVLEENQLRTEQKRKVSWPDAHGKDIAHVHEFETR